MHSIPQRQTLIHQTAQLLKEGIKDGFWKARLPGERLLSARYQVSRNTLRAALDQLRRDGFIESVHGSGSYIRGRRKENQRLRPQNVALLSPEPISRLRPTQALLVDELRTMLSERGENLHVFHGKQWFRKNPGPALKRLVTENPHAVWILTLSNAAIQHWFSTHGVRCVVAGSVHEGISLPSCDIDHRAMCRHAAGVLLGLGHRKIALVIAKSQLAGDLESEAGFLEGVERRPDGVAEAVFCRHDGSVAGVRNALHQVMRIKPSPTGILVANAHHCLTVFSALAEMQQRVPADVSLISRDNDEFLSYLTPEPARYAAHSEVFAKSLLRKIQEVSAGRAAVETPVRLMPEFIRGKSIAALG